jgi:HKD family nuclease
MLDPRKNTVDYGELLSPPIGYVLKRAVGTSYSLDLQALLAIPVALYYGKPLETDYEKTQEPLNVFDAISKSIKTVTIFCQKGKIKVPKKFNKLISFTEECVKEIIPNSALSSFHPKCWWLWFKDDKTDQTIVRFAITSRNLSFDRCWDVSFCFEGFVTNSSQPNNNSMVEMLKYLNSQADNVIEDAFVGQLSRTAFENDLPFNSWVFHPIGVNSNFRNPLENKNFKPETLLMMSPFIDDNSVISIAGKASDTSWLFSRKTELQKLKAETLEYLSSSYCIPEVIVQGEWTDNKNDDIPNAQPAHLDLHAKLFIGRKGRVSTWFLGSANLTQPAFGRNMECLIELKTNDSSYWPEAILKELISNQNESKLFETFLPTDELPETELELLEPKIRRLIYSITCAPLTGKAEKVKSSEYYAYDIEFNAKQVSPVQDVTIFIQPWSLESEADHGLPIATGKVNRMKFQTALKESQLSKYFVITLTYKKQCLQSFLLKGDIYLPQTRHGKILAEIINSKEKFLLYLRFLLGNSGIIDEINDGPVKEGELRNSGLFSMWNNYSLPLYEELLKASSQHPEKLRSIDELFTKLKADENTKKYISPELDELWSIFKQVIN